MFKQILAVCSLCLLATACGAQDAINSVIAMNKKMDQTNTAIGQTNSKMDVTNLAIHNQTLAVALDQMMSPENTTNLFPPTSMMAPGQVFANVATSDEIVQLVYVLLLDVNDKQPDPSLQIPDKAHKGKMTWPDDVTAQWDHDKMAKLTALQVICGLMPDQTVQNIIDSQITAADRYQDTAYQVLMLRYLFIDSFMLTESLLSSKVDNPGVAEQGITYIEQLRFIEEQPFASSIKIATFGMLSSDDNLVADLSPAPGKDNSQTLATLLSSKVKSDMDPKYTTSTDGKLKDRVSKLESKLQAYSKAN